MVVGPVLKYGVRDLIMVKNGRVVDVPMLSAIAGNVNDKNKKLL
jgi:ribosomal 30S subunit maturation factor RimM